MTEKPTILKTFAKNSFFGFTTWLLPLAFSFIVTRIIVKSVGIEEFGIYAFALRFIGYSFAFNFSRAITKYSAEHKENNPELISKVFSASLLLNLLFIIPPVLFALIFQKQILGSLLAENSDLYSKTQMAFLISLGIISVNSLATLASGLIQGFSRFDLYAKLTNLLTIGQIVLNIIVAILTHDIVLILWATLFSAVVQAVITFISARSIFPTLSLTIPRPKKIIVSVLRFSSGVVGYQVISNVLFIAEHSLVMRRFGADWLAFYSLPITLAIFLHSFTYMTLIALFPLASDTSVPNERLKQIYISATRFATYFVVFAVYQFYENGYELLKIWVGEEFSVNSSPFLLVHGIGFGIAAVGVVSWQLLDGIGRTEINFYTMTAVVGTATGIMLFGGLNSALGFAIARLLGMSLLLATIPVAEKIVFGKVQITFWFRTLIFAASSFVFLMVVNRVFDLLNLNGFQKIIYSGAMSFTSFSLLVWFFGGLSSGEKELVRSFLPSFLQPKDN